MVQEPGEQQPGHPFYTYDDGKGMSKNKHAYYNVIRFLAKR